MHKKVMAVLMSFIVTFSGVNSFVFAEEVPENPVTTETEPEEMPDKESETAEGSEEETAEKTEETEEPTEEVTEESEEETTEAETSGYSEPEEFTKEASEAESSEDSESEEFTEEVLETENPEIEEQEDLEEEAIGETAEIQEEKTEAAGTSMSLAVEASFGTIYIGSITSGNDEKWYRLNVSSSGRVDVKITVGFDISYRFCDSTGTSLCSGLYESDGSNQETLEDSVELKAETLYFVLKKRNNETGNATVKALSRKVCKFL